MLFPITFSIPECKIIKHVPKKCKLYGHIYPGDMSTYIFNDEDRYYKDYQDSVFGFTKLKGGWDCLRHYEILANGCIPWFENLGNCPPNIMTHLPKTIIRDAMYELEHNMDLASPKITDYVTQLLEHTRTHLTTKAMAQYVLKMANKTDAKSILYLSKDLEADYIRCLTLHGFKELYGAKCHDSPCIPHLYSDFPKDAYAYGKGFSYTRLLDKLTVRDESKDATVIEDIKAHAYDIIIYGSIHRGMPYWEEVNAAYKPEDVILFCGEDFYDWHKNLHNCSLKHLSDTYPFFMREIP